MEKETYGPEAETILSDMELRAQLAEREDKITNLAKDYNLVIRENAALRAEVEQTYKAWCGRDYMHLPLSEAVGQVIEATSKQTAQEILNEISQEEIRRILLVGDPRTTTVSSGLLTLVAELRQRFGLEG